jgi:phenylpropionate dioxygenase-like ring-hydroxylating dioxygenase large terminal subunit
MTPEENELLTRVGPGTPMGQLFRRFWLPALLSEELPAPDCPPVRVRLLGEDLIAFRDSEGRVGLLGAHCAHRGAPLFYGRNEEAGLRCVYHGWKYDVTGQCVDMPSEPAESTYKERIRQKAYPARERGGMVWAYIGPPELTPELPDMEWALVPEGHRRVTKWLHESNYLQGFEGDIDTAHASFLHSYLNPRESSHDQAISAEYKAADRAPKIVVDQTDYGFRYGARRRVGDDQYNWRVTQWLLPTFSLIAFIRPPFGGRCWIPIDDEHTWTYHFTFHPERPLNAQDHARFEEGASFPPQILPESYVPVRNRSNEYLLDRELQRTTTYTGIYGVNDQDRAIQEGMGAIYDRGQEHLGTSDIAIVAARQRLLKLARDLQQGIEPSAVRHPDVFAVRALDAVTPHDEFAAILTEYAARMRAPVASASGMPTPA